MNDETSKMLRLEEIPMPDLTTSIQETGKCYTCNRITKDVCQVFLDKPDSNICRECNVKDAMQWFWEKISKMDFPMDQKVSYWYQTLEAAKRCGMEGCYNKGFYLLKKGVSELSYTWLCNDCLRLITDDHKNEFHIGEVAEFNG